jgi:serine/threonine-protein phosphatase PGAM5
MAIRYLYFVRHGQFDANLDDNPKGELTELGKKQAKQLIKAFKNVPVTCIHVSTAPRALQTADPLIEAYPEAKVDRAHRLLECVPPVPQAVREGYFSHLSDEQLAAEMAHAERIYDHYLKRTAGTDRHEIVVSHGNVIRYLTCRVIGVDPTAWVNLESRNCGITRIMIEPDGNISLISYNEIGHLPAEMHTDNLHVVPIKPAPQHKNGKK